MSFLAAGWLALLGPWAALVWWTLRAAPTTRPTTSAFLWPSAGSSATARARRWPQPWTIAALAALASAIVALAGPATRDRAGVFVVVDPSYRTTLGDPSPAATAWRRLATAGVALTLVVPGQPDATSIADVRPTARSTADGVAATVGRSRRAGRDVVVIGDADVAEGEHVRVVTPTPPVGASFEQIGARSGPRDVVDVWVRVARTLEAARGATLVVRSGDTVIRKQIEWADGAASTDAFARLSSATDEIEARVELSGDTMALDDVARLAREPAARLAIDGTVPPAVGRFAAAYARSRPTVPTSGRVSLTSDANAAGPAVIVADGATILADAPVRRVTHPIVENVDLDRLPASSSTMPAGFAAIAWRGDRPIVAMRDTAGRRAVWVGLDVESAAREPTWVVLLDQSIAWAVGDRGAAWSSETCDAIPAVGWRARTVGDARVDASPGTYVDADERPHAANLPARPAGRTTRADDAAIDAWLAARGDRAARSRATWPATIAAGLAGVATMLAVTRRGRRGRLDVCAIAT